MAFSVTPPSQSYLASNPLTRAAPKRVPQARGTAGSAAVAIPLPPSSSSQKLSSSVLEGSLSGGNIDELYRRYSLSTSGRRRSIASSPTVSSDAPSSVAGSVGARVLAPTAAVTQVVGFQTAASTPFEPSTDTFASKGKLGARQGLLSKAFSNEVLVQPQELVTTSNTYKPSSLLQSSSFVASTAPNWFPGVDMQPLQEAQEKYPVFREELVVTAYSVAARAHQFQSRKNGDTMLSHCMAVAGMLAGLGLDAETVAAGLLHEVLAGDLYRSQLEEFMPASVVSLIDRVATVSEMSRLYRAQQQAAPNSAFSDDKFSRMLVAMEDVRVVLIKLADRIHNMRTISALPQARQEALARETLEVYSVVANRLGVWCLKAELEDLAFSILHPEDYAFLKGAVRLRQDPAALEATINTIKASLQAHSVAYEDISGRPKNLYGIWSKLKKDGKPLSTSSLSTVYDLMALRVVVPNKHDCYAALRAVQACYRIMPERSKDFIKDIKKPNGYQSLHETVHGEGGIPVEVQIRTHKMHYIAEYGFAAHWKYKEALCSEDEWLEKETQYKRWLTQYKLGVHDKKVRPQGSPPTDSSLKRLGVAYLDCPDASHLDPFLRHQRFKLQLPVKSEVSVLLQTQDSIETKDFPLGTTAHQLWEDLGLGSLPGYALTVNSRLPAGEAALQSGDLIQVVPLSAVLGRNGPASRRMSSSSGGARRIASVPEDDVLEVFAPNGMQSTWQAMTPALAVSRA